MIINKNELERFNDMIKIDYNKHCHNLDTIKEHAWEIRELLDEEEIDKDTIRKYADKIIDRVNKMY